jgi:aminoglycoside/choline kinase family phosphotransferase
MKTVLDTTPGLRDLLGKALEISGVQGQTTHIAPLFGDGSDRRFFRIRCGLSSLIALISPRAKENIVDENDSYLLIGRHLFSHRLPVPRIFYADPGIGHFLLEDVGDLHLQRFALSHRSNLEPIYSHVVKMLAALHRRVPEGFRGEFCFDTVLYDPSFVYERELEYFRKSFLNGYLGLETAAEDLRPDFESLADAAGVNHRLFVFHRDFQSRNIMVSSGMLRLLDFQGMRFGPPEYDLASLLIDPYVQLASRLQEKLTGMYWAAAGRFLGCTRGEFLRRFEALRLCRNMQMLGAFGYLGIVKGKRQFLNYIPPAWEQLLLQLRGSRGGMFPRLERVIADMRRKFAPGKKSR